MLDGISKGAASAAALPPDGSSAAFTDGGFSVTLPWWPVGAALALLALAAVFRYGAKLQRETEGLV
jgi:type VI protein secretion system component VasF